LNFFRNKGVEMGYQPLRPWILIVLCLTVVSQGFGQIQDKGDLSHFSLTIDQPTWDQTRVRFKLNDYDLKTESIKNHHYTRVVMGQASITDERGYPELPKVTQTLAVPCDVLLEDKTGKNQNTKKFDYKVEKKVVPIKTHPPVPSKGSIQRDINPDDVAWTFAPDYSSNSEGGMYPLSTWSTSKPFILRDLCGINLTINPFRYDFATGELEVLTEMEWILKSESASLQKGFFRNQEQNQNESFQEIYSQHFANISPLNGLSEIAKHNKIQDRGKILLVTTESFIDSLKPWQAMKHQLGFETSVIFVESIGYNWQAVKSSIKDSYDKDKSLAYVVIVGDAEIVPFHPGTMGNAVGRPADPMYGLIDGEDSYPELIVGRIPVKTSNELDLVLHKIMSYEFKPDRDGEWYQKAMGIASREGDPTDAQRAEWLRESLLDHNYKTVDRFYEPWTETQDLLTAFNEGRGFVNYTGHGSPKAWATGRFSSDNIDQLQNTYMFPVIVSVACVNGRFDYRFGDSFAERWLKAGSLNNPTGAIAIFASSTNQAWVPPTVGQKHITHLLTKDKSQSVGFLFASGAIAVLDDHSSDAEQTFQTWHIFGDPTLQMRTTKPNPILARIPDEIGAGDKAGLTIDFVSPQTHPLRAVISSIRSSGNKKVLTKKVQRGESSIVFTSEELKGLFSPLTLTISGPNRIPLTGQIKVIE
jgi:hypothetical protein